MLILFKAVCSLLITTNLLVAASVINSPQSQFNLDNLKIESNEETLHYSAKSPNDWPIDLSQYEDDQVIRLSSEDSNEIISYCQRKKVCELWTKLGKNQVDIKINKFDFTNILLKEFEVSKFEIIIDDLPQRIYETYPKNFFESKDCNEINDEILNINDDIFFKEYRPLNTIYSWFDLLAETFSGFVSVETIGTTYEGRKFKGLFIDTSKNGNPNNNPNNKTIIIAAGIHAREWISVSSANYIIYKLLINYGISKPETDYLDQLNVLIIPVFNPDGYSYSWTDDRLWRKNRQETYLPRCFGIDIDHSFGYRWQQTDDTSWPCDEDYSGESPSESIEVQTFEEFLNNSNLTRNNNLQLYGYLDLHSYAQEILYPYAYSCDHEPRDKENLIELAYGLSKAIRLTSDKYYEVLPACKDKNVDLSPGLGSGSSLDYMYNTRMAHWAFQMKLRDSGSHGFLLPSKYITPVGEEIYQAVKYFFDFILDPEL